MDEKIKTELMAYSRQVYGFCYHLTGNRMDADDLYQDTFLTAWEKRGSFEDMLTKKHMYTWDAGNGDSGNQMRNYLLGIAANIWRNKQRKKIRRSRIAPFDEKEDALAGVVSREPSPESDFLQQEMLREVRRQVAALPDKLRVVVVMYYAGEMSTKEIAARLEIPAATVRSRLNKARKRMRKGLEGNGYERLYG